MTTDQQIIALALAMGAQWREHTMKGSKEIRRILTFVDGKGTDFSYGARRVETLMVIHGCNNCWIASDVPRYDKSRDAIIAAEEILLEVFVEKTTLAEQTENTKRIISFVSKLNRITTGRLPSAYAKPHQRLEALLRTLNLWTS